MNETEVKTPPKPTGLAASPGLHADWVGATPYAPEEMHAFHKNGAAGIDPKRLFASAFTLAVNSTQNTAALQGQLQTSRVALTVLAMRQGGMLQIQEKEANKVPATTELLMQIIAGSLVIKATVPKDKIVIVGGE